MRCVLNALRSECSRLLLNLLPFPPCRNFSVCTRGQRSSARSSFLLSCWMRLRPLCCRDGCSAGFGSPLCFIATHGGPGHVLPNTSARLLGGRIFLATS